MAGSLETKDKFEAGLVLTGAEVKSLRLKNGSLSNSFVRVVLGEALVFGFFIGRYTKSGKDFPNEDRARKILLNRSEIDKLSGLLSQKGVTSVPLKVYSKDGLIKMEIGVGRMMRKWQRKDKLIERQLTRESSH